MRMNTWEIVAGVCATLGRYMYVISQLMAMRNFDDHNVIKNWLIGVPNYFT